MKTSPLQLDTPQYPLIDVRAYPHDDEDVLAQELPVKVECVTTFHADGDHFSMVSIRQSDKKYAYTFHIRVFVIFRVDVNACKETYKSSFNPAVVAVNVARILYSGARELLATISCRAPHGAANLPSVMLEPKDVEIGFDENQRDHILMKYFCFSEDMLAELNAAVAAQGAKSAKAKSRTPKKA